MSFVSMRDALIEHFNNDMAKDNAPLFTINLDKDQLWNIYLSTFKPADNPLYRERTEHDCSCCRGFIKSMGNVVAIKDEKIISLWDFDCGDNVYAPVLKAMSDYVHSFTIDDMFLSVESKMGCHHNFEHLENGDINRYEHFYLELPRCYVARDGYEKNRRVADKRDTRNVFRRSLDEFSVDAVDTVLELISQNSLYRGEEWKAALTEFRKLKVQYEASADKELFAWANGVNVSPVVGRIRNHSMGTLLIDVSNGVSLDEAVRKYEAVVAPSNYKRSTPVFTQKMLEDAQKKIVDLGYMDSLPRRFATLDDITVNDILFSNRDAAKRIEGASDVFSALSKETKNSSNKFSRVEEITADKFVSAILPTATDIQLYLENKHVRNFVSLIAPQNPASKSMFKWGNNFGWAYTGNMTDSMKERVKAAGGKVDGDLRFSIQWNEDGRDIVDLDAHCTTPNSHIYFNRKHPYLGSGDGLDVDMIRPSGTGVENIIFADRRNMDEGVYSFWVNNYDGRSNSGGFRAEIEFDGQIYSFNMPPLRKDVELAKVTLKNGQFSIKVLQDSRESSKTVWNVATNDFVPVTVICNSPNFWDGADKQTGHKHLFFMLKDCINDERPAGIFNEFLVQDLYEHRRVMEALGNKMCVEDTSDQLSGLGFALDQRNDVVLKVTSGTLERTIKVKF